MSRQKTTGIWFTQDERDRYKRRLRAAGLTHRRVADTYGCRRAFVTAILSGHEACPFSLRATIDALLENPS